jgi:hypothetical protein
VVAVVRFQGAGCSSGAPVVCRFSRNPPAVAITVGIGMDSTSNWLPNAWTWVFAIYCVAVLPLLGWAIAQAL